MTSLRRDFSWTLLGNVVYAGCQWLVIVIIAKLASPALLGKFTLGIAVCAPIMFLCGMSLRTVLARDLERMYPFGAYLGLRLVTTVIAISVIAGIALVNRYPYDTFVIVMILAFAKAAEAVSEVFWGQFQQQEKMAVVARSMILKGGLSVVAVAALLRTTGSLRTACAGLASAWFVTLLIFDIPWGRLLFDQRIAPMFEWRTLRRLGRTAVPLGFVMMLASFANNVPRYFVSHYSGDHALGIFSAIANLMVAGHAVFTALGQAVVPRLSRHYLARDRYGYVRLIRLLGAVALAIGLAGVLLSLLAGKQLLAILYTQEYAESNDIFVLTMVAALAAYMVSAAGVTLVSAGQFTAPLPLQAFNVAAVAVGCAFVVPTMGAVGAAWVIVGVNIATAILFGWRVLQLVSAMPAGET